MSESDIVYRGSAQLDPRASANTRTFFVQLAAGDRLTLVGRVLQTGPGHANQPVDYADFRNVSILIERFGD